MAAVFLDQKIYAVDNDQMQGIIDIEKIFHLPFSARAVIERKRNECEKRHPLIACPINRKEKKGDAKSDELGDLIRCGKNDDGCEDTPDAVIHAVIRRREQMRKDLNQKNGRDEGESEEYPRLGPLLFHGVIQRIDQKDGEGERDEDALIERIHRKEIDELTDHAETEHLQKIFQSVFRVFCALGDHEGEDGKRQSADIAQDIVLRKKLQTCMVTGHGDQGEDLQLIARKPPEEICFHIGLRCRNAA